MRLFKRKNSNRQVRLMEGQDEVLFRRSRTLVGSKSSDIRAANEGRAELKSDRVIRLHLKRQRRVLVTSLLFTITISGGLWYLINQYIPGVELVRFEPSLVRVSNSSIYARGISDYLSARPSERFRFGLNTKQLSAQLSQALPEVKKADLSPGLGNNSFIVTLRQPVASWKVGEKQYFVDEEGAAFQKNYYLPPTVIVTDNSGASVGEGDKVASERFLRFLGRIVAITNNSGVGSVVEASLPVNTTREIDIKLKERGYFIKTNTDRDPAATVEDMKRVVNYLDQRKLNPVYVDLRIEGRAYYR